MNVAVGPAAMQRVRFAGPFDTPSDVDVFERHWNEVTFHWRSSIRGCVDSRGVVGLQADASYRWPVLATSARGSATGAPVSTASDISRR